MDRQTRRKIKEQLEGLEYDCATCDQYGRCGSCDTPRQIKILKKQLQYKKGGKTNARN